MSSTPRDILDRHAPEIVVGGALLGVALTPPFATAAVGQLAMLLGAVFVLVARPRGTFRLKRPELLTLAVLLLAIVVLLGTSLAALNPGTSFLGKPGQHTGSSLWLAAGTLFIVLMARARQGDVGRIARGLGVAGAVLAAASLLDKAGLIDSFRFSPEPAGLLESSATLGQVLVVTLAASVAWAIVTRRPWQRYAAWGSALLCATAIGVSGARSALLAVVIAAAFGALASFAGRKGWLSPRTLGIGVAVLAVAGLAGLWFYLGSGDFTAGSDWAELTNNRSVIWETAVARAKQSPALGQGADQFSAWVTWDVSPDGRGINRTGTYDPHNLMLYWLVSGGIVGFVIAVLGLGLVFERLWALVAARGHALSLIALISGVVGWLIAVQFMWASSLAVLMVSMLLASLLAAGQAARGDSESGGTHLGRGVPGFVLLAALITIAVWWGPLSAEFSWGRAMEEGALSASTSLEIAQTSLDPAASAVTVGGMLQQAGQGPEARPFLLEDAAELLPILEQNSGWHADAAYAGFQFHIAQILWTDTDDWDLVEEYLESGRRAVPNSGLWDYSAAVYAEELGYDARATTYAGKALAFPLPAAATQFTQDVINRAGGIAPSSEE